MTPTVLDAKHVLEKIVVKFPFTQELPAGVTIASVQIICTASRGTPDATPAALVPAAAVIADSLVLQPVIGGVAGATYLILAVATLSNAQVLVRAALLPVISFV